MYLRSFWLALLILLYSCNPDEIDPQYRDYMRDFISGISNYSKSLHPGFLIIPQNGIELVSLNGEEEGPPDMDYLSVIDANGQEDLLYGYRSDDRATPSGETAYLIKFLNISLNADNTILVTDYCYSNTNVTDSYASNEARGFISFAASHRELDNIPSNPAQPHNVNTSDISGIGEARNFLYLLNPENFTSKEIFLQTLAATDYDLLIIDLFFNEDEMLTAEDVGRLRIKSNGGSRLVVAYMSIGEAEVYRYYWQESWKDDPPSWLDKENPDWEGNYKVKYWDTGWQAIIFGNDQSYLKRILDSGFDGVYLDIIEAFEYYE